MKPPRRDYPYIDCQVSVLTASWFFSKQSQVVYLMNKQKYWQPS
ncbi:hypothetical Protein YC6258_04813 [Gynuella sunshinyii YC6258]|uniref:Uncharacterized protein n=1 Tax=Gynuella sunshinyii YC6258 TaxID=1445510 RepID=A0A0C5VBX7_9GAMM|nr:hypothetical Protein YC6258_04813 [Gynuella sunshinyii YC6258]